MTFRRTEVSERPSSISLETSVFSDLRSTPGRSLRRILPPSTGRNLVSLVPTLLSRGRHPRSPVSTGAKLRRGGVDVFPFRRTKVPINLSSTIQLTYFTDSQRSVTTVGRLRTLRSLSSFGVLSVHRPRRVLTSPLSRGSEPPLRKKSLSQNPRVCKLFVKFCRFLDTSVHRNESGTDLGGKNTLSRGKREARVPRFSPFTFCFKIPQ